MNDSADHSSRLRDALVLARATVAARPEDPQAWMILGDRLRQSGSANEAVDAYRRAVAVNSSDPEAFMRLGHALMAVGSLDDAIAAYRRVLTFQPDRAAAWANIGLACDRLGRREEALAALERAVAENPKLAEAHVAIGNIRMGAGDTAKALESYERARVLRPDDMLVLCNLSTALLRQERIGEAEQVARHAIAVAPNRVESHRQLASVLALQDRPRESIEALRAVLRLDPNDPSVGAELLYQARQICDWQTVKDLTPKTIDEIRRALAAGRRPMATPFTVIAVAPELEGEVGRTWTEEMERTALSIARPFVHGAGRRAEGPLRIGYLSGDYRAHATMHLIGSLFSRHDRHRVRSYAYSYGLNDNGRSRLRVEMEADSFVELRTVGDREAAERIHADGIDILVDLKGHTAASRLAICVLRPAPIQLTWIGFPGPLGARFIDYALVDRIVVPPEHQHRYVEGLCYLPNCYQINDDTQPVPQSPTDRAQHGLPAGAFVFASFNRLYKLHADLLDLWAQILRQVPNSVLWLYRSRAEAVENVLAGFRSRGVDPQRIVFAPPLSKDLHLQRIGLADLALDTYPINGHTTTSDCLRAGLPVVATLGNSFASRVSASLLHTMTLDELVVPSEAAYGELAVALARDPVRLAAIRARVAEGIRTSPLFDTARFVRNLETAYETMMRCRLNGALPRVLEIEERRDG